jgi:hypothetical protein
VGLANLSSESETCVGSCVRHVGILISFEKNFYRLSFTPLWFGVSFLHLGAAGTSNAAARGAWRRWRCRPREPPLRNPGWQIRIAQLKAHIMGTETALVAGLLLLPPPVAARMRAWIRVSRPRRRWSPSVPELHSENRTSAGYGAMAMESAQIPPGQLYPLNQDNITARLIDPAKPSDSISTPPNL